MKRTKQIKDAVVALTFSSVEHELSKQSSNAELGRDLLTVVKQTGALLVQHANPDRERKRDLFVLSIQEWFETTGNMSERAELETHLRAAKLCERAFRAVYTSLDASPAGQVAPEVAAWAALLATAADMTDLMSSTRSKSPPIISPNSMFHSADSLRIDAFGQKDVNPDAAMEHYSSNLGGYLKMLGYRNAWFDESMLKIPAAVEGVDNLRSGDRSAFYLAGAWNQVDDNWGKIRYFDGSSVRLERRPYLHEGVVHESDTLVFCHEWEYCRDIEVARARLRCQVFEIAMDVAFDRSLLDTILDPANHEVKLAPQGLISADEAWSLMALQECYGLPVMDDLTQYLGLSLPEWLRGYALLRYCCLNEAAVTVIAAGLCYIDVDSFTTLAERAGIVRERILVFLKQVTFQKNSRDIYDAPLIRTADHRLVILSCLFASCALHEIVTSRINSLLLQVQKKGSLFEGEVRDLLEAEGVSAKRVKYKNSDGSFECDAVITWGEDLLLLECKAYTLPQRSASDLFYFRLRQREAVDQIRRVAGHFEQDPSVLEKAIGLTIKPARTTMCVLNLAPFLFPGSHHDVKSYDRRALSKFFEGAIKSIVRSHDGPREENVIAKLWAGDSPVAGDLLNQMDNPYQYQREAEMWSLEERLVWLSGDLAMMSPFLRRRPDELPPSA